MSVPIRWLMLAVLFLVRLAMGYQFQSVASTASYLVEAFGFSYAEVGTLIGFYLLPGIVIAIPSGSLTRLTADKALLIIGAVAMIIGALVMGFADTPTGLYAGRLITGIGGTIFNVILTKMVTDWFFGKEIVTALSVMLTAWPIGIALGLLSHGLIADAQGWPGVMHATALVGLIALMLTAFLYREAPRAKAPSDQPSRYGLPQRQLVHMSIVGLAWTLFNASFIIVVSFAPDVLIAHGYEPAAAVSTTSLYMWAAMVSIPLGGRLLEVYGHITLSIIVTLTLGAIATVLIAQGVLPTASFIALGIFVGIPAGALMALSAQAVSPANRGPGLGILYTWYYLGMAVSPALAGWTRDVTAWPGAPIILAAALLLAVIALVQILRFLQTIWPIEVAD